MKKLLNKVRMKRAVSALAVFAGFGMLAVHPLLSGAENPTLRVGLNLQAFAGLSPGDARVAMVNLMTLAGREIFNLEIQTYEDDAEYIDAIRTGSLDFFPIFAIAYLDLENQELVEPAAVVSADGGDPRISLVLLTAQEVQPGDLSAAEGKTLMLSKSVSHGLERIWLEVILAEAGLPKPEAVFAESTTTAKASEALLATFFGKNDFCILARHEWETLSELNPQLALKLNLVAESKPLLTNIMAFHRDCTGPKRDALIRDMTSLHERVAGQQVLTLTRVKEILPFEPVYMEATRQLIDRHRALFEKSGTSTAAVTENLDSR